MSRRPSRSAGGGGGESATFEVVVNSVCLPDSACGEGCNPGVTGIFTLADATPGLSLIDEAGAPVESIRFCAKPDGEPGVLPIGLAADTTYDGTPATIVAELRFTDLGEGGGCSEDGRWFEKRVCCSRGQPQIEPVSAYDSQVMDFDIGINQTLADNAQLTAAAVPGPIVEREHCCYRTDPCSSDAFNAWSGNPDEPLYNVNECYERRETSTCYSATTEICLWCNLFVTERVLPKVCTTDLSPTCATACPVGTTYDGEVCVCPDGSMAGDDGSAPCESNCGSPANTNEDGSCKCPDGEAPDGAGECVCPALTYFAPPTPVFGTSTATGPARDASGAFERFAEPMCDPFRDRLVGSDGTRFEAAGGVQGGFFAVCPDREVDFNEASSAAHRMNLAFNEDSEREGSCEYGLEAKRKGSGSGDVPPNGAKAKMTLDADSGPALGVIDFDVALLKTERKKKGGKQEHSRTAMAVDLDISGAVDATEEKEIPICLIPDGIEISNTHVANPSVAQFNAKVTPSKTRFEGRKVQEWIERTVDEDTCGAAMQPVLDMYEANRALWSGRMLECEDLPSAARAATCIEGQSEQDRRDALRDLALSARSQLANVSNCAQETSLTSNDADANIIDKHNFIQQTDSVGWLLDGTVFEHQDACVQIMRKAVANSGTPCESGATQHWRISCDSASVDDKAPEAMKENSVTFWRQSIVQRVDTAGVHVTYGNAEVSLTPLDADGFEGWDKPVTSFLDYPVQLFATPPQ